MRGERGRLRLEIVPEVFPGKVARAVATVLKKPVVVKAQRVRLLPCLFLLIFVSTDCSTVPVTGRSQLVLISDDEMAALSDEPYFQLQNYFRQSGRILSASESPEAEADIALINNVCNRLLDVSGLKNRFQWEITVVKASEPNASVLPNGKITVFTGIIPVAQNAAGLAAVIGHEIGHVMARHSAERLSRVILGDAALRAIKQATARSKYRSVIATAAGLGMYYGVHLPFNREEESEADRIGQILMAKAGYNPAEAIEVWKRMDERGNVQPWEFLSTHPSHATRQAQLKEWLPEAMTYYADAGRALPQDVVVALAKPSSGAQTRITPIALRPSLAPGYWVRVQRSDESTPRLRRFDRMEHCEAGECVVYVDDHGTTTLVSDTYEFLVEARTPNGVSKTTPPIKLLSWPLSVGSTWSQSIRMETPDGKVVNFTHKVEVISYESVETRAGSFMAFKMVASANNTRFMEYWYSPETRSAVRVWERNGTSRPVTTELLDYDRTDAPVITVARTDLSSLPKGFAAPSISKTPAVVTSTPPASPSPMPGIAKPVVQSGKPSQNSPASLGVREKLLAQLYLVRGPIVSKPPQAFRGTFSPDGKAEVILAGNRRLTGNFDSFSVDESIAARYKPTLISPDALKIPRGADVKGFAALSDGVDVEMECVYAINKGSGRGEGTCVDNQRNTYRLVFD